MYVRSDFRAMYQGQEIESQRMEEGQDGASDAAGASVRSRWASWTGAWAVRTPRSGAGSARRVRFSG